MATTQAFVNFTKEEYKAKYGVTLETQIPQGDAGLDDVTIAIEKACRMVTDYIEDNSPSFDKTAIYSEQNTIINEAAMMQMQFLLKEGDYSNRSGYDGVSATKVYVPNAISPNAQRYLKRRIIYRGL